MLSAPPFKDQRSIAKTMVNPAGTSSSNRRRLGMKQAEHRTAIATVWIWAIPVAALGVVVWLDVRSLAAGGPEITVTFADAGGVEAGNTKVIYNKMEVGRVESVKVDAVRHGRPSWPRHALFDHRPNLHAERPVVDQEFGGRSHHRGEPA
jgi:hypothetical protein